MSTDVDVIEAMKNASSVLLEAAGKILFNFQINFDNFEFFRGGQKIQWILHRKHFTEIKRRFWPNFNRRFGATRQKIHQ